MKVIVIWDKENNKIYHDDFLTDTYFKTDEYIKGYPCFQYWNQATKYLKRFDKEDRKNLVPRAIYFSPFASRQRGDR